MSELVLFGVDSFVEDVGDLGKLLFVKLDEVVGHGLEVAIEVGLELGQGVVVAVLGRTLHLEKVELHVVDLLLLELAKEVGDLGEHLLVGGAGLGKRLGHVFSDDLLLRFVLGLVLGFVLGELGGLFVVLSEKFVDLVDVLLFELGHVLSNRSHVSVLGGLELGKLGLITIGLVNLGEVVLEAISLVVLKGDEVGGDLGEKSLVGLFILVEVAFDLVKHGGEVFFTDLGQSLVIGIHVSIRARVGIHVSVRVSIHISVRICIDISVRVTMGVSLAVGVAMGVGLAVGVAMGLGYSLRGSLGCGSGLGLEVSDGVTLGISLSERRGLGFGDLLLPGWVAHMMPILLAISRAS